MKITPKERQAAGSIFRPDQGDAEDITRRRRFTAAALLAGLLIVITSLLLDLVVADIDPLITSLEVGIGLLIMAAYLVLRRGYVRLAGFILSSSTFVVLFLISYIVGDLHVGNTTIIMLAVALSAFMLPRLLFSYMMVVVLLVYVALSYNEVLTYPDQAAIYITLLIGDTIALLLLALAMSYFSNGLSRTVQNLLIRSGELGQVNNQLTNQQRVRESAAAQVAAESDTVAQLTSEQLARLQQAVAAFQQTQVSAEQLSQIAAQIAAAAGQVQAAAAGTLQQTANTQAQVTVSVGNIEQLFGQVNQIVATAAELAVSSRNIEQVVATIQSLSDEVRLLSLNAAIEAAGAGEYGRRFSVIADEVRGLSDAAEVATRQVGQQIGAVLSAIQQVASASQQGIALANQSQSQLATISTATQQINSFSSQTSQLADQIRLTTDQQRQASQEMAAQMHSLAQLASLEASSAAAGAEAAARLREVASQLARPQDN